MRLKLYRLCPQCNGTGEYLTSGGDDGQVITCPWPECSGSGYVEFGGTVLNPGSDDIIAKCNEILAKCNEILAEIQGGE